MKVQKQYTTPGEQIRVNDIVRYLDKRPHPGIPQRLAPQWTGPHQVVEIINRNQLQLRELERSNTFIVHISHVRKTTWEEMVRSGRQPIPRAQKDPDLKSESAFGSTIEAGPEDVDVRVDQPHDEILERPRNGGGGGG